MENPTIAPGNKTGQLSRRLIQLSYIYAIILTTLVWLLNSQNPKGFAGVSLAIGLFFLWGICSAFIMYETKDKIKNYFETTNYSTFVLVTLGGIFLALIEEAFATLMTNLAPLFGFSTSEVFITASADYIEVVTQHSVIVFVPWFIAWGIVLHKYTIHPNTSMVLFGITGLCAEVLGFGLQHITELGFWIIIYGLMIYLPAYITYSPKSKPTLNKCFYPFLIIISFVFLVIWSIIVSFFILAFTN